MRVPGKRSALTSKSNGQPRSSFAIPVSVMCLSLGLSLCPPRRVFSIVCHSSHDRCSRNKMFRFLLRWKRAQMRLDRSWKSQREEHARRDSRTQQSHQLLRMKVTQFFSGFLNYIQVQQSSSIPLLSHGMTDRLTGWLENGATARRRMLWKRSLCVCASECDVHDLSTRWRPMLTCLRRPLSDNLFSQTRPSLSVSRTCCNSRLAWRDRKQRPPRPLITSITISITISITRFASRFSSPFPCRLC